LASVTLEREEERLSPERRHRRAPLPAWACVTLATVTTALSILFRYGYSFGLFDQIVYSVRGIALADPDAFARDWFAQTVPQPHWLFDAVTFAGTRLGILPWVYLAYWLAGIAAFALASVWLTQRYLPHRPVLAALLGPLVVLGPEKILGSTTPLLWFADPHMLGGCLAFLALAALLTDRWRAAALSALLAWAVHVQHGANLAPILLLTAALASGAVLRRRLMLAGTGLFLLVGALAIAQWRGLETSGGEWLTICRDLIPFHCYAPSWSWSYLAEGGAILALAFGFAWWRRHEWRAILPVAVVPAAGLLVGVVGERFQLGIIGRLAEQYNVHRLATVVEPFAAFALVCLVAGAISDEQRRRVVCGALATPALLVWFLMTGGALQGPAALGALNGSLGHVGVDRSLPIVRAGEAIGDAVPPTGIIAAPPELVWLRSFSRRGVVADCKAVPFGGPPWQEYVERMRDLGGHCRGSGSGFRDLSPADIETLRARYGVTHLLLYADDAKVGYAGQHWRRVLDVAEEGDPNLAPGLVLFDITRDEAPSARQGS
jgi:hypothetical protein